MEKIVDKLDDELKNILLRDNPTLDLIEDGAAIGKIRIDIGSGKI